MLSIVATPIGNLDDITVRAINTLKSVDFVVCEDTRHSRILLNHYSIKKPLLSFHSYSPEGQLEKIIHLLKEGKQMALVADAGTPGISDPGYRLIRLCLQHGIQLTTIPGPSAFLAALPLSGLPMDKFLYLGFLPLKKGRQKLLRQLADFPYTLVVYEAPHRLLKSLTDLHQAFGDRHVAVCRELTKLYEEVQRGTLSQMIEYFSQHKPRGEFVIVIETMS